MQTQPNKIYVPFYSCDSILEPILKNKIEFEFFHINKDLTIREDIVLGQNDLLLYINYFGVMTEYSMFLAGKYPNRLIIDNTHAFYEKGIKNAWTFNSARKFFGVADGAFIYSDGKTNTYNASVNNISQSNHLFERKKGNLSKAFLQYKDNEKKFNSNLFKISDFSIKILNQIDYKLASQIREDNFNLYFEAFEHINQLKFKQPHSAAAYYPFLVEKEGLREDLIRNMIYIPTLWNDVLSRKTVCSEIEFNYAKNILPLPCDQRYGIYEISKVINLITQCI